MSRSILVTGGAGYIGAHVTKALDSAGYEPVVYDNLSTGHRDFLRWGHAVEGDIADFEKVCAALRTHEIVAAIHLAGSIEVGESMRDPAKYYENNVAASLVLLRALRACRVNKLVYSSSAAVYGNPETVPIPENHPANPVNVYGRTKRVVEEVLTDLASTDTLRSFSLRYFNAAGATEDGTIGEDHQPETHLIPRACLAILGKIPALDIYGNDFGTPDGTPIRDYVHVEDLAAAHVLAVEQLLAGERGYILNVGTGRGHSVLEVLGSVERVAGRNVPHRIGPRREGDPAVLVADPGKAGLHLGWKPQYDHLDDITESAWHWHRKRHGNCA